MSYIYETENYKGFTINIKDGEWYESPRDSDDNLGTFVTETRNYCSPDEIYQNYRDGDVGGMLMNILWDIYPKNYDAVMNRYESKTQYESNTEIRETLEKEIEKHAIILRVYKYDHGNVIYSTSPFSCSWDSGHCGYIYVTMEKIRQWFNVKKITSGIYEKAIARLEYEVDIYTKYANGEYYLYEIIESGIDDIEVCGSYLDVKTAMEDAKESVDYMVTAMEKQNKIKLSKKQSKLKDLILNKVPLVLRQKQLSNIS